MNKKLLSDKPFITQHPIYKGIRVFNSTGFLSKDIERLTELETSNDRVFAIKKMYFEHEKKHSTIEGKSKLLNKLYKLFKKEEAHLQRDINSIIHSFTRSLRVYKRINTEDIKLVKYWNKKARAWFGKADEIYEEILAKKSSKPTEIELRLSPSIAQTIIDMKKRHQNESLTFIIRKTGQIEVINGTDKIIKKAKLGVELHQVFTTSSFDQIKGHITKKRGIIIIDSPKPLKGVHLSINNSQ